MDFVVKVEKTGDLNVLWKVCKINQNYCKPHECLCKLSSKIYVKLFCFKSKIIWRESYN